MELPKRKPNRLCDYNYSQTGAYFITICTQNRERIFWDDVGADDIRPYSVIGNWVYEAVGFQTSGQAHLAKILL